MVNAAFIMARIIAELPADRTPEHTDERLPYIYLTECSGGTSEAKAEFLLRAFEDSEREANKELLKTAFRHVLADYPNAVGSLEFKEQYLNMKKFLTAFPQVTEKLEQAVQLVELEIFVVISEEGTVSAFENKAFPSKRRSDETRA